MPENLPTNYRVQSGAARLDVRATTLHPRAVITARFSAFAESDATQVLGEDGRVNTLRQNLERRRLENRTIP